MVPVSSVKRLGLSILPAYWAFCSSHSSALSTSPWQLSGHQLCKHPLMSHSYTHFQQGCQQIEDWLVKAVIKIKIRYILRELRNFIKWNAQ